MVTTEAGSGEELILTSIVQLRFYWVGDRWKHDIQSVGRSEGFPLIWSIEGGHDLADHSRIVSPTYQRIDIKPSPTGARATLGGEVGPHHFSATFDVSEAENGVIIDIDVAVRCECPVTALAATYTVEDIPEEPRHDRGRILWDQATHHLILAAKEPTTISAVKSDIRSYRVEVLGSIEPAGEVHRLRYRWRWSNEPDLIPPWRQA